MRRLLPCLAAAMLLGAPAFAACPSDEAVERLARTMLENQPGEPLAGMTSLADGQCAQDKLVALLQRQFGRPVGYKVGLTNPTAQQRFGVSHPVTGMIYEATLRMQDGAEVPARFGAIPVVEADLLVRVRNEGINQARTHEEVLRHLVSNRTVTARDATPRASTSSTESLRRPSARSTGMRATLPGVSAGVFQRPAVQAHGIHPDRLLTHEGGDLPARRAANRFLALGCALP